MTYARQKLGIQGETIACEELEKLGYAIIERRYRTRFGEIDVIANDRGTVVFVEVKTKSDGSFGDPVEEVTPQKQRQIVSMGEYYATYCCPPDTPCRFDVPDALLEPRRLLHRVAVRARHLRVDVDRVREDEGRVLRGGGLVRHLRAAPGGEGGEREEERETGVHHFTSRIR